MVGSRDTQLTVGLSALIVVLAVVCLFLWRGDRHHEHGTDAGQVASQRENVASLMRLSAAGSLSADEQARLNRAGGDPDEVRQALLEIHELRLSYARRDLENAQAQRAALGNPNTSRVPAERAKAVREHEQASAAQVARYADALSNLQSWQPGEAEPEANVAQQADASGGTQEGTAGGAANAAAGMGKAGSGAGRDEGFPAPPPAAVAEAAQHPTITVYADGGTAPAAADQSAAAVPDQGAATAPANAGAATPVERATSERGSVAGPEQDANRAHDQAEIRATLQRWAHAMMLNDPRAETAEYSPHLERYFLYRNVDRSFVEADKAAYLRRGNITARFTVENLHFENETPDSADLSLVKDVAWQRSRDGSTRKLIRSRLHLVRTGQGWKIAGEQDFR